MNVNRPDKIVVFDLDETLGFFTEFGIFCDCLNNYFKNNKYSDTHFNDLLDLYPEFIRPKMINILQYLKNKKEENKCYKVMIYTNNQGPKIWAINIKKYFEYKIKYNLFDQIIAAFKVRGEPVEIGRTSHDKTTEDLIRCTKIPHNTEICFIDDIYHSGMANDNVYYINVKPYHYYLSIEKMILLFLDSQLGKHIKNKEEFINIINREFKKYNYKTLLKSKEELEIDEIIGKKMLQHLKQFFYDKNHKTYKRQNRNNNSNNNSKKNKTLRRPR